MRAPTRPSARFYTRFWALPRATKQLLAIHVVSSVGSGLVLPFLAIYVGRARAAGASVGSVALVALAAGSIVANVLSGRVIDHFGSRPVLQLGWILNATGDVALVVSHTPAQLLSSAMLIGTGAGFAYPALRTLLASVTPSEQQPLVFSAEHALLNLGFSVGALVAAVIVATGTIRQLQLVYLLDAATFIFAASLAQVLLATPRSQTRPRPSNAPRARAEGYREVLANQTFMRLCVVQGLLVIFGYVQFTAALPLWLSRPGGLSPGAVATVIAINTVTVTVMGIPIAALTDRSRRTTLMMAGAGAFAATWVILPFSGIADGFRAIAIAGAASAVMALGETLLAPAVSPLVNRLATDELRGRYNAADALTVSIGTIVGPAVTAALIDGPSALLFGVLILGCLAAVIITTSSTQLRAMR